MAKTKIPDYSSTAGSNTDIDNINIAEGCSPANVNNAIRGLMAQLKDFQSANPTYYTADSDALAVGAGGTGAITATTARTNLSAAKSGANSDITSITGLTTALSTLQGGTGAIQKAISNVARASNVVTITTTTAHGFTAGDYVTVAAVTNTGFNGTFVITTVGSTTFTYAQTAGDVASVADTGTVLDISYCNLVNNVTGILPLSKGGLGVTSLTPNAIPIGNGTSPITSIQPGTNANVLTSTAGATVNAGSFVVGTQYTIATLGTPSATDFISIGASSNTVGVVFTATGAGSGNGTATTNTWASSTITFPDAMTLLGTITLSGTGNQFSLGSLTLTNYKLLYVQFNAATGGHTTTGKLSISNTTGDQTASNTMTVGAAGTQYWIFGGYYIDLLSGVTQGIKSQYGLYYTTSSTTAPIALGTSLNQIGGTDGPTAISTSSTTIYLYYTAAGTRAGSIKIYGIK
jgi:hypothetical protein